jgi:hypothetical protein
MAFYSYRALFRPSPDLPRWLMGGAVAALVVGCLEASSCALELLSGSAKGFTLSTGLSLSAILPEILVLIAFVKLAKDAEPDARWWPSTVKSERGRKARALKYSSLGWFLSLWLSLVLAMFLDTSQPKGDGSLIILMIVPTILLRVGFALWFAICLIRLRDVLGAMVSLLGWMELLCLVFWLALRAAIFIRIAGFEGPPGLSANQVQVLLDKHLAPLNGIDTLRSLFGVLLIAILTCEFFLALRRRLVKPA